MTNHKPARLIAIAVLTGTLLTSNIARAGELIVFAAASLKNGLDEAAALYEKNSGDTIALSYAGSSALARQIEQGAPADIFFSADIEWMNYLDQNGLVDTDSRVNLLGNEIVMIAPKESDAALTIGPGMDIADLLGTDGRLAMGEFNSVPAGLYAKAALKYYDVWDSLADHIVQTENVRIALAFVANGEAPLGIVYATDAAAEPTVKILDTFPDISHEPIRYPVALTTGNDNPAAAAFLQFLKSSDARPAFENQGFVFLDMGSRE
jgi:molybdate transport system substrate-binding protein